MLSAVAPLHLPPAAEPIQTKPNALIGRFTVTLGGLLGAGCLLVGLGLVVLMVVAPKIGSTGATATGPGWTRTGWHLGVGLAAEVARALTMRRRGPIRVAVGAVSIVAVLAVTAFSWWR
jgi:hypothetical protein